MTGPMLRVLLTLTKEEAERLVSGGKLEPHQRAEIAIALRSKK